jgi:hypothetical protein
MKTLSAGVALLILLAPYSAAQDKKAEEALAKALKEADAIFTAAVGKVSPQGQTNSIPPSTFGNVTFKDAKALRGTAPEAAVPYSVREGMKHIDLTAKGQVLVAVKKSVTALVPATEANLALAKKVIEADPAPKK